MPCEALAEAGPLVRLSVEASDGAAMLRRRAAKVKHALRSLSAGGRNVWRTGQASHGTAILRRSAAETKDALRSLDEAGPFVRPAVEASDGTAILNPARRILRPTGVAAHLISKSTITGR